MIAAKILKKRECISLKIFMGANHRRIEIEKVESCCVSNLCSEASFNPLHCPTNTED